MSGQHVDASCFFRIELSSLELESNRSFAISKRINNFDISRISDRHWPFGSSRKNHPPLRHTIPRWTPATYVPTQELERMIDFRSSRVMPTNAIKSTTTEANAIDSHKPGHHLLVCTQLCGADEF